MYYTLGLDHVYNFLHDTFNLMVITIVLWMVKEFLIGVFQTPVEYGFRVVCGQCEIDVQRSYRAKVERDVDFEHMAMYHNDHKPCTVTTWDGVEQTIGPETITYERIGEYAHLEKNA